ncbi:hypothetical protein ACFSQT_14240 [Mesorhizobium calcicola]|uniref:Uncharacterized protein n=1 Tax=Mesorhizobium calcicola TaxID=1300310 RepID=A0ABW4WDD2_9HYPH
MNIRSPKAIKADLALSILDNIRQRGLSVEAVAEIAGVDVERMRALVERREIERFVVEEMEDILEAVDASGPRFGGRA